MLTIKQRYLNNIKPDLMKAFSFDSVMEVPKVEKIVVNMGVGDAVFNSKALEDAVEEQDWSLVQKMIEDLDDVYSKLERQESGFGYDSDE